MLWAPSRGFFFSSFFLFLFSFPSLSFSLSLFPLPFSFPLFSFSKWSDLKNRLNQRKRKRWIWAAGFQKNGRCIDRFKIQRNPSTRHIFLPSSQNHCRDSYPLELKGLGGKYRRTLERQETAMIIYFHPWVYIRGNWHLCQLHCVCATSQKWVEADQGRSPEKDGLGLQRFECESWLHLHVAVGASFLSVWPVQSHRPQA